MRIGHYLHRSAEVVKRSPVITFFILAFLFTWSLLPLSYSSILFSLAALCGPAVAAIVVSLICGKQKWEKFRQRLTDWKISPVWYGLALLLPIVVSALRSGIEYLAGAHGAIELQPINTLSIVVFILVIGEEAGWRGFALPELMPRSGKFRSSLIIGILWAFWHLPLFFMPNMPQFGSPFPAFIFYTIALSVILTFLAVRTRYSVIIATVFHGAVNTFGFVNTAADSVMRGWANAVSYGLVALAIIAAWGYSQRKKVPDQ